MNPPPSSAEPVPALSQSEPDRPPAASPGTVPTWLWTSLLLLLAFWVASRLGAFHLMRTVTDTAGQKVDLPDTFTTVDHPFHIARAADLLDALRAGEPLRWISNHQGGYPVEFYPLGVAWLDVALWGVLFGHFPIAAVHKLVIILIFLLPGLAYALMARRDGWRLSVALVALAAHVAVPGGAWSGGYVELVDWGMVTNVAANVALLFVLVWLASYLDGDGWQTGTGAAIAAALAIYANPRSLIALAVVGASVWLALAIRPSGARIPLGRQSVRLAVVAVLAALLAAPELVSLIRFEHLYYFVRYSLYPNPADYLHWSALSVSWPVLVLAVGGVLAGLALPIRPVTRAAAVTLALYILATAVLSSRTQGVIFEQLETKRLMPFQRLLEIYLAAVALLIVLGWIGRLLHDPGGVVIDAGMLVATGLVLLIFVGGIGNVPAPYRGLYALPSSAQPALADFEEAVKAADVAAKPGTAILILGSQISWHQQLWAPIWSSRMFFYDDWLWYWQTKQPGPYEPQLEHAYDYNRMNEALTPDFLRQQGIGAVIVTETARVGGTVPLSISATDFEQVRSGLYSVYLVRSPDSIVTFAGNSPSAISVDNQSLTASGTSDGGTVLVRRNWYPRWHLTVNGKTVPITETADGYMEAPIPAGLVTIHLTYTVDWLDWLARAALIAGVLGIVLLALFGRSPSPGAFGATLSQFWARVRR